MKSNNADPSEIAKFDAIAQEWWDPKGPMKPLHQLNPLRLSYIQEHVDLKNKTVLDVGCGGGILTESLAKYARSSLGIDLSAKALKVAEEHALHNKLSITYQEIDVEILAQHSAGNFDVITCMEMLEHVPNPETLVKACATLLKPGGFLFFSTLNRNPRSFLHAIIGAEYLLKLLPRGTHHYEKFIRPSELNHWAQKENLILKDIRGMKYSLLTDSFSLNQDVSVNYLCCYKKPCSKL